MRLILWMLFIGVGIEFLEVQNKMNSLLLQEECHWKQRPKTFWLKDGDENTIFFHASATTKKRRDAIVKIMDD